VHAAAMDMFEEYEQKQFGAWCGLGWSDLKFCAKILRACC
jgi:hypothetical protein